MKSPSRNIPISTVTVAASVVDMLAPSERSDSPNTVRTRGISALRLVTAAALITCQPPVFEPDDAAAHLVDHLAVVGHHQDRRSRAVDPIEKLHDPDRRIGVEVPGRLV